MSVEEFIASCLNLYANHKRTSLTPLSFHDAMSGEENRLVQNPTASFPGVMFKHMIQSWIVTPSQTSMAWCLDIAV